MIQYNRNTYKKSAWLYDLEQNHVNRIDEIPFYLGYAEQQNGEILELGCGTGRVSLPLAEAGFNVTALDLSQQMLDFFSKKIISKSIN